MPNITLSNDLHGRPCWGWSQTSATQDESILATTIHTTPLPRAVAAAETLLLLSGSGPAALVTTAPAAKGDTTLAVVAILSGITSGAVYQV